ncbi:MAG: 3-phosphoshikimate 1-carboxyvinyltransferase [Candidatus Melainabacteria bacterium]|nr:MAG: 3-phosphoshikimate 1-carboxyvinyltransferase [Candidatus Melainabacteria bacterium]
MDKIVSKITSGLKGEIVIPSDKSISHRAIMFSSLAKGETKISNFSRGADCHSTLKVFSKLGIEHEFLSEQELILISDGKLKAPTKDLNCGNSGTTMRLVSGILAGQNFDSVLFGDESLSKRPMKRVIEPLSLMGAKIDSNEFKAPLKIYGQNLHGIEYNSKLASAQVKSCVLLAGLHADEETIFIEPYVSRDHTERMLKYLGADIQCDGAKTTIKRSELTAHDISICGDISSATFFIVAGLIVPNSDFVIKNVGLNPTRTGILDVVKMMGGDVEILDKKLVSNEEVGDLRVRTSELHACEISGSLIPRLIDELPVIAVLATQAVGTTVIKDAQDLRNKESDRITAVVKELRKFGADIDETLDGFIINGKTTLKGDCEVDTYHDHRLAMSMYIAGLISESPVKINEFQWVDISFPEFESLVNTLIK